MHRSPTFSIFAARQITTNQLNIYTNNMNEEIISKIKNTVDTLTSLIAPDSPVMSIVPNAAHEMLRHAVGEILSILKSSEMSSNSGSNINYQELYDLLKPIFTDDAVIEEYNNWKNDLCHLSTDALKSKRMQKIMNVLEHDIMKYDKDVFNWELEKVNEAEILPWLSVKSLTDQQKRELAKLIRHLIREGDIVMINRQSFGKYASDHMQQFSDQDARAMFALEATLDMVNADLVAQNPKLQTIINKYRPQPKPLNDFAPAIIIKKILTQPDVMKLVSDTKKYTTQWIEQFIVKLLASDKGKSIIVDWANTKKRIKIPALVAGTLISAGVFNCSKPKLARAIRVQHDFTVTIDSYATYMGCKKEQPYLEWVQNYVKSN